VEDVTMAASTTSGLPLRADASTASAVPPRSRRRRRIDRESGRALEILSHAIEYLKDEYVHHGGGLASSQSEVQAMQLLMAVNREIYIACPEILTFEDRCASFVRRFRNSHRQVEATDE
jgi:hypothetical protein